MEQARELRRGNVGSGSAETARELERRWLDPGDLYEGRSALDLGVLVSGHQGAVDGDPLAGVASRSTTSLRNA